MIYCEAPVLEEWLAPPQDDMPRPLWTKLLAGGALLSNSIEYADWVVDPVQPIVCESCWNSSCSRGGLARIRRIGDHLLWFPPKPSDLDELWRELLTKDNFIQQTVLMPITVWDILRRRFHNLPTPEQYGLANRGDLALIWLHEMSEYIRAQSIVTLELRLREAIASDPLDLDAAKEIVKSMACWILQEPLAPLNGKIVRTRDIDWSMNTFYFDGLKSAEWQAFLIGRHFSFALGPDWAFVSNEACK